MLILKILICLAMGYALISAIGYLLAGWAITNKKSPLAARIRRQLEDKELVNRQVRMATKETIEKHGGLIKYRAHLQATQAKRRKEERDPSIGKHGE